MSTEPAGVADHLVVGGGSAGAILAARLAERGRSVLLLEAGPRDWNPWIHVPLGFGKLFDTPALLWPHEVEGGPGLGGRRIFQPRGRVLGGTGSINGMTYMRGSPAVFDRWGPGWRFADLLPYFRRAEGNLSKSGPAHGSDGPIRVSDPPRHPLMEAFIASAEALGLPRAEDFNAGSPEGAGYFQFTVADGRRSSSATGYLRPVPAGLRILTGVRAERIVIAGGRATGVVARVGGQARLYAARAGVILAAGAFGSPHLLQLSGIGPGAVLTDAGLPVLHDLPAVGRNGQDHFESRVIFRARGVTTLNDLYHAPLKRLGMGLRYILSRSGPMAATGVVGGGFFRGDPDAEEADIQINLGLWSTSRLGPESREPLLDRFSAFRLTVVDLAPEARMTVTAVAPDPAVLPRITAPFLETERDCRAIVTASALARRLAATAPLSDFAEREAVPGVGTDLLAFARQSGRPNFHTVGTCRMGDDDGAVVDRRLRVRGLDGLWVADASIMPVIPNANTNAAVTAIAEKAADLIAGPG